MINNITITAADDITTLSDDVNIYPIDLSGTINTLSNGLNWLEKCSYFRPIFFSICCQSFWELMATEYTTESGAAWDLLQLWNFWVDILFKDILGSNGMFE